MKSGSIGMALVGALVTAVVAPGTSMGGPAEESPEAILQEGADGIVSHNGAGVIGMARAGDDTKTITSGYGDQFMRHPAKETDKYRIGSNTKAFVSTVLLQLEEEGKLSLDDTVAKWLPDALSGSHDGSAITIKQLLNHTSGVFNYTSDQAFQVKWMANLNPHEEITPQQLVDVANNHEPEFAPGTDWGYSNTNYVLAGMIIEAVTGNAPDVEVTKRIIEPLGLKDTTYPAKDPELHGEWLHGYFLIRDVAFSNVMATGAAGAIVSTLDDQAKFSRALLQGDLLSEGQLKKMKTTVPSDIEGSRYGLGIMSHETPCGTAWGHSGAVVGYTSHWLASEDGQREVVMAHNSYLGTSDLLPIFKEDMGSIAADAYCATK